MSDEDVSIKFGAQTEGAVSGVDQIKEQVSSLSNSATEASGSFGELGGVIDAVIAAISGYEFTQFIEHFANLGNEISTLSNEFNLSTDQVQEWGFAAKISGSDIDVLSTVWLRLQRNIDAALTTGGKQLDAFSELGLSADYLRAHYGDLNAILLKMADGYQALGAASGRNSAMVTAGGRGVAALLPLMADGSTGLQELTQKAKDTGDVFSGPVVKGFQDTHENIVTFGAALEGLAGHGFAVIEPGIDKMLGFFTDLAEKANSVGIPAIVNFTHELQADLYESLMDVIEAFRLLSIYMAGAFNAALDAAQLKMKAASEDLRDMSVAVKQEASEYAALEKAIDGSVAALKQQNAEAAKAAPTGGGAGGGNPPASAQSGNTWLQDQQDDLDKALYQYQIFGEQAKELDKEFWTDRLAETDEGSAEQLAIEKKLYALEAQDAKASTSAITNLEKEGFNSIGTAFDQMVQGIMQGTQTWQQAMDRLASNLIIKFTEMIAKMTAQWAVFEATGGKGIAGFGASNPFAGASSALGGGQSAAQTANTAALQALNVQLTALNTELTGNTTATVASTTADTASAASTDLSTAATQVNTAGQSQGIIAWAANTIATIANTVAEDGSKIGSLLGFDVGTASLPFTGPIMAHKGEMILPPDISAAVRSGSMTVGAGPMGAASVVTGGTSSGGGSLNFNITALDSKSVITALNSPQVMAALSKNLGQYYANNPSVRGAY